MSQNRTSRRALRLDGTVRGVRYAHRIAGETRPTNTGHAAQFGRMTGYAADDRPEDYDPGHAAYVFPDPSYYPPDPWHDAPSFAVAATPPTGSMPSPDLAPMDPAIDHDLAGWLHRQFVNEAELHRVDVQELFDPHHVPRMKIGEIKEHMQQMHEYSEAVFAGDKIDAVTDNYFVAPSPNQIWSDAVGQVSDGLESIAAAMREFGGEPEAAGASGPDVVMAEAEMMLGAGFAAADGIPEAETWNAGQLGSGPNAPLEQIVDDDMQYLSPLTTLDPPQLQDPYAMGSYGLMDPGMLMNPLGPMPPGF